MHSRLASDSTRVAKNELELILLLPPPHKCLRALLPVLCSAEDESQLPVGAKHTSKPVYQLNYIPGGPQHCGHLECDG